MSAPEKKDDAVEAVARLIRLTQEGALNWSVAEPAGDIQNREGFEVKFVFTASYKGRYLRLYGYRRKVEDPGPFGLELTTLSSLFARGVKIKERTYPYWEDNFRLELMDHVNRSLWTFPDSAPIGDLLRAIRYQVAGVKEFLDDVLGESQPSG